MTTIHERELEALLRQRADLVDVPGDFAPAAIAKRHRDQRNRAVLGAVAFVAAVAVAVPSVWSRQGPAPSPVPAITTPTSVSSSTSGPVHPHTVTPPPPTGARPPTTSAIVPPPTGAIPTHDSDARPASSRRLAFGPVDGSPEVAYAVRGVLNDGGRTLRLPVTSNIRYLARLANGGALVHGPGAANQPYATFVVDSGGTTLRRITDVQDVRAKPDGTAFTTVDMSGRIHLYDSTGRQLSTFSSGDINTTVSGWYGDIVYHTALDRDTLRTYAWDTATGKDRLVTSGHFQDIDEQHGLALLMPNQSYRPDHTCYGIYDLNAGRTAWMSCGTFAPTHFAAGGSVVVGPEVADGAGTSSFKIASTADGSIVARITLQGSAWSPGWVGHDAKALAFTLLNGQSPTKQTLASCSIGSPTCTIDLEAKSVTAAQRDTMDWPIVLSDN